MRRQGPQRQAGWLILVGIAAYILLQPVASAAQPLEPYTSPAFNRTEIALPRDSGKTVEWCGAVAKTVVVLRANAIDFLDMSAPDRAGNTTTITVPHGPSEFHCTADGSLGFLRDRSQKAMWVVDMATHRLTLLVQGSAEINRPFGRIVSNDGQYILDTGEFPDTFTLPNGRTLQTIKGFYSKDRRNSPRSAAWSADSRRLFLYYEIGQKLVIYDVRDGTKTERVAPPLAQNEYIASLVPAGTDSVYVVVIVNDSFERVYSWNYLSGQSPRLLIDGSEDDSIQVSRDGTAVISRSIYLDPNRARLNTAENTELPDATEIDLLRDGKVSPVASINRGFAAFRPAISDDGSAVAYVERLGRPIPTEESPYDKKARRAHAQVSGCHRTCTLP